MDGANLDYADMYGHASIALYLAWLGADCKPFHLRVGQVTFQTWVDEGYQQQAQYWAVSADDSEALDSLATTENVEMDVKNLRNLAKFYNHGGVPAAAEDGAYDYLDRVT